MNLRKEFHRPHICHIDHTRFDHFLLTRFAVYGPGGEVPDDTWLKDRFKLFENYCLPSVRNQTCQVFRWGLLVSPDFPAWARERLLGLGFKNEDLIVSHDWRSATTAATWIHKHSVSTPILTTRLDNDDALASTFMKRLHANASFGEVRAYNFTHGLQLTVKGVLLTRHLSNPFLSLSETGGTQIHTILANDHDHIGRSWNLKQIGGAPAWLQVIHGNNLANVPRGLPAGKHWAARDFKLPHAPHRYPIREYVTDMKPLSILKRRLRLLLP